MKKQKPKSQIKWLGSARLPKIRKGAFQPDETIVTEATRKRQLKNLIIPLRWIINSARQKIGVPIIILTKQIRYLIRKNVQNLQKLALQVHTEAKIFQNIYN